MIEMKRLPKLTNLSGKFKGISQTTFPVCPSCRKKTLKEFYPQKNVVKIICTSCGFNFIKEDPKWVPPVKPDLRKNADIRPMPGLRGHKFSAYCVNCKTTRWFEDKKFPKRSECLACGEEKDFKRR